MIPYLTLILLASQLLLLEAESLRDAKEFNFCRDCKKLCDASKDCCKNEKTGKKMDFSKENLNSKNRPIDCKEITKYAPVNLLMNIMRTLDNVSKEDHQQFKSATNKLINRIYNCNPKILQQLNTSIQCMNLFTNKTCAHKFEICEQNRLYMYPMYCTAYNHLSEFYSNTNYQFILQLYYGIGYAFQMINAEVNKPLRCDNLRYDVHQKYLKVDTPIDPEFGLIIKKDICKYYIDYYYNLYADKNDPEFLNCQKEKTQNKELNDKVDNFLSMRSTNDLLNFMRFI